MDLLAEAGIRDGAWRDRPCYILGGGPSLRDFPFEKLEGHLVLATNLAFTFTRKLTSLFVTLDYRFLEGLYRGDYDGDAADGWEAEVFRKLDAPRLVVATAGKTAPDGVVEIPRGPDFGWNDRLEQGVATGRNSGFVALQLAAMLGANPIYLLGFDMKPGHFHGGHPWPTDPADYTHFSRAFEHVAPLLAERGIEVVNLNPDSALECFPRRAPKIPKHRWPTFLSYHTDDALYSAHAARLRRSLALHGLPHRIESVAAGASWMQATQHKAKFLREMRDVLKGPIVWTDADSTIERAPVLFEGLKGYDIAIHKRAGRELLSGTIWFADTKRADAFLDAWLAEILKHPHEWDQGAAQRVITKGLVKGLRVLDLPPEYCCIKDGPAAMVADCPADGPVILHHQASREARRREGSL